MMTERHHGGPEPVTDSDLIRHLDGELGDDERIALEARIAASPEEAGRLRVLRRRSTTLAALLADTDPPGSTMRSRAEAIRVALDDAIRSGPGASRPAPWLRPTPALRAAALIALLLAGAFAVPPARAWVAERVRDVAEALGLGASVTPLPTPPTPADGPAEGADVAVRFPVTGDTFDIHLARPAGTLLVSRVAAAMGSAEAETARPGDPGAGVRFVVMPAALRIDGADESATYRVTLPAAVRAVRIRAGDMPAAVLPLGPAGEAIRLEWSGQGRLLRDPHESSRHDDASTPGPGGPEPAAG